MLGLPTDSGSKYPMFAVSGSKNRNFCTVCIGISHSSVILQSVVSCLRAWVFQLTRLEVSSWVRFALCPALGKAG